MNHTGAVIHIQDFLISRSNQLFPICAKNTPLAAGFAFRQDPLLYNPIILESHSCPCPNRLGNVSVRYHKRRQEFIQHHAGLILIFHLLIKLPVSCMRQSHMFHLPALFRGHIPNRITVLCLTGNRCARFCPPDTLGNRSIPVHCRPRLTAAFRRCAFRLHKTPAKHNSAETHQCRQNVSFLQSATHTMSPPSTHLFLNKHIIQKLLFSRITNDLNRKRIFSLQLTAHS